MANVFEYAGVFQNELDKAAVEQATSGWMELNDKLVRYDGGSEVKIPSMDMDGLADYDRDKGFVEGSVNLKWETKSMTQDRGRQFTFDENEVNETNFVVTAARVMGEFQRTKVVPEIDAYRYSKLASLCAAKERAGYGYTPPKPISFRSFIMTSLRCRMRSATRPRWSSRCPVPWPLSLICPVPCPNL